MEVNINTTFSVVISPANVSPKCSIFINGKKAKQLLQVNVEYNLCLF